MIAKNKFLLIFSFTNLHQSFLILVSSIIMKNWTDPNFNGTEFKSVNYMIIYLNPLTIANNRFIFYFYFANSTQNWCSTIIAQVQSFSV